MAKGNRPLAYPVAQSRFLKATAAATKAQEARAKAQVNVRIALAKYGEGSLQYKKAVERSKAAYHKLRVANKRADAAARRLDQSVNAM